MDRVVFRVRQLPPHVDRLDAVQLVSKALGVEPTAIRIFSLARSVDPWIPTKIATLMFDDASVATEILEGAKRPNINKRADEWNVKVDSLPHELIIDKHFRGLTPLHDPTSHVADCIAISGLASHPFGSWQPQGGSKTFMWIRDALPHSLPHVRPILYGYDTTLHGSSSFQSIFDIALGLINQLKAHGWSSPNCKPLAFLAHSLGGIVLKQAFIALANKIERDDPILRSSHLMALVEGQPNRALVADLSPDSLYLQQLDVQFNGISCLQEALLFWCYETQKSPTVVRDSNGEWSRTGPQEVLVTPDSATHGLYTSGGKSQTIFPINENHSSMVKFSENDPNFLIVVQKLAQILSIEGLTRTRSNEFSAPRPTLEVFNNKSDGPGHALINKTPSYDVILKSLQAPERDRRLEQIEEKYQNTFDWIYDRAEANFSHWLQTGSGLFWINGKPGSGKSTLMKFIFQDHRTSALLHSWNGSRMTRVAFFFHYRGTAMQKSFEGLLRSILSQLIRNCPNLCRFLQRLFDQDSLTPEDWTLQRLQRGFHDIIKQDEEPLHLCLFLDAIDEYDGRLEFICKFLIDLGSIRPTAKKQVKVCFSSRPWDIFMVTFRRCLGFSIQDFTQADIGDYCLGTIKEERLSAASLEELIPEIVMRSRGVFLWVRLVVKDLADATRTTQMSKSDCEALLNSYPTELELYYGEIVERIPHAHRWKAYSMLEVAVRSKESLRPVEFLCAVQCSECKTFQEGCSMLQKLMHSKAQDFALLVRQQSRIYCGGLIEVVGDSTDAYIQVLHQTVEDFVRDPKFKRSVLGDRAKITVENGNTFLAKGCFLSEAYQLRQFYTAEYTRPQSISSTQVETIWQSTARGTTQRPHGIYSRAAEQTSGRSIKTFLDSIPNGLLTLLCPISNTQTTPLAYAASTGLRLYIVESLARTPNLLRDSRESLLTYVINPQVSLKDEDFVQTARLLLDNGYTFHQDPDAFSTLVLKIFQGEDMDLLVNENEEMTVEDLHIGLAGFLLERGACVDTRVRMNDKGAQCTPLHISTLSLARLLLEKGAQVNALDSDKRTPLDYVCSRKVGWGPNLSGTGKYDWDERQMTFEELYDLTCLLATSGGKVKKTKVRSMKLRLDEYAMKGWATSNLRESLIPPRKSRCSVQ
ncbi:uncharacterized protein JN550_006333 [Neoarthrinium moseri]|uniref:uncharacterized protein n=1 Tax=Neoarthrinium moseri TaxID=1658444 RepID=UPI001FDB2AD2|nr:uncharacterized protein JN550_006333 [Neoarthrinium moseri]KAI1868417.1 hypothetical protein JN550_006333 [Neoarthrinium moseri]